MYDAFGCKRPLYLAALDASARRSATGIRIALNRTGSPLQDLRRFLRERQREFSSRETRGCFLGVAAAQADADDDELAQTLNADLRRTEDAFHDTLADPRALARLIVATLQGLAITGRVVDGAAFAKGAIDAVLAAPGER